MGKNSKKIPQSLIRDAIFEFIRITLYSVRFIKAT